MDTCSGLSGTKSSLLSGVILFCLLPTSNTRAEMGRQHGAVAMAMLEDAEALETVQTSAEASNSRNIVKRNSAASKIIISHARQKRSASLPRNNNVPSDETTSQTPVGLASSTLAPSSVANTNLKTSADETTTDLMLASTGAPSNTSSDSDTDSNSTDLLTSSIPVDTNDTLLLNQSYVDDNDTLSFNQTDPLYVSNVQRFVKSEAFIISVIVGICVLITLFSVSIFLCYRRCSRRPDPATKRLSSLSHHSCNGGPKNHDDAVTLSYINAQFDQKFLQDNPEEMQSLENDTFLNSLESMMFVNRWTDSGNASKL